MNILGKNFGGYFLSFVMAKACLFLSSILVARNIDDTTAGNYFLVLSIAGVISSLTSVTVGKFAFKYISEDKSSKIHDVYFKQLNLYWLISVVFFLLIAFFAMRYLYLFDASMAIVALVFICVYSLSHLLSWYLRLYKKDALSQLVILAQPFVVCCLVATTLFSTSRVEVDYNIIVLSSLIAGAIALLFLSKGTNLSVGSSVAMLDMQSFKYFFLASFSAIWLNEIDNLMIPFILGVSELSDYKLAFTYSSIILLILTLVGNVIPRKVTTILEEKDYSKLRAFYFKSVKMTALLSISVSIFVALVLSFFRSFFFSAGNDEVLLCFYVLQACFTLVAVLGVVSFFAIYVGLEKLVANNIIVFGLLNVVGNFFLISEFGIIGAALSTGLSTLLSYIVLNFYFINRLNHLLSPETLPQKGGSNA
ncbi:lipopolysaccharide biosynthesis protein [Pseudoalteromonas umbrosa]|uniref:lipopolysaccharide biosynthesis protein n=1 Tax=Pseudoalteromonas umbrosa TaxID=3048489 RepID=UPI0024C2562F|nr:oligosaccharide flippase family protein [Pseudoalteromonas sp. B95]MDK1289560.1 oligosaccharide flippase family protein [Pseudoalteromonas sp. B95]